MGDIQKEIQIIDFIHQHYIYMSGYNQLFVIHPFSDVINRSPFGDEGIF